MAALFTSLIDMLSAHPSLAIGLSFLVAFGEALLILGLFVPSTTVLVGAGTLVGVGELPFWPIFLATVIGAVLGDAVSYWIGWRYNERIRQIWPFSKYPSVMAQGEAFFARYGGMSIFIVRFIPGAKAVVPAIAAMAGMPVLRFTVINVASAFVWAAVHLLPAIALGRGIRVAHVADPRLMILIGMVTLILILVWYATRLAYFVLLPRLDRWRRGAAERLARNPARWAQGAVRVLENRDGLFVSFALGVLALLALRGFFYVLASLVFAPGLLRSDQAISTLAQSLRDETVTHWMIVVTMLGDTQVLVPLAVLLVGLFLLRRQWGVAAVVLAAILAAAGFEPLLAAVLTRAPPTGHIETQGLPLPGGHSAHATVIYGMLALFVARAVGRRYQVAVYLAVVVLVALISVSRIYLLAHWPSDVLAGVTFGTALVLIAAFLLHGRAVEVSRRGIAALLVVTVVLLMPLHVMRGYHKALETYVVSTPEQQIALADWLAGGWQKLAPARILLDGDYGEPMLIQSDRPIPALIAPFLQAGWTRTGSNQLDALLGAILPTSGGLAGHSPWPLTHVGRTPLVTLVRPMPGEPAARYTLRLWDSGQVVIDGTERHALWLGSFAAEALDPVTLGYALLEPHDLTLAQTAELRAEAARLLGVAETAGGPLIAPR